MLLQQARVNSCMPGISTPAIFRCLMVLAPPSIHMLVPRHARATDQRSLSLLRRRVFSPRSPLFDQVRPRHIARAAEARPLEITIGLRQRHASKMPGLAFFDKTRRDDKSLNFAAIYLLFFAVSMMTGLPISGRAGIRRRDSAQLTPSMSSSHAGTTTSLTCHFARGFADDAFQAAMNTSALCWPI